MKTFKSVLSATLLSLLLASPIYAQLEQEVSTASPGDLIWADEFNGTGEPDPAKWERQEYNRRINDNGPDGWWSKEDSYLDGEGNLIIRLRQIDNKNDDDDTCDYSVGALRTKGKFEQLYGKFEIRCKLPTQPGWWVAFWMMQGDVGSEANGGVDGTEVDVMEGFGWTDKVQHAFHWDGYGSEHKSISRSVTIPNIREGFHTYSMEWYPEQYIFYIDGEETWRSEGGGVCNQAGYVKVTGEIFTVDWAISNSWANHPRDAVYPDSFVVDYIRVYEVGEYVSTAPTISNSSSKCFTFYPNPVDDQVTIQWDPVQSQASADVTIFDSSSRLVKSFSAVQSNTNLDIADLTSGIYFITVKQKNTVEYHKLLKE